jgi:SAM-dependent methyltransferase
LSTAEYYSDDALMQEPGRADVDAHLSFSQVFAEALRGEPCSVQGLPEGEELLPVHRWVRSVTPSDRAVLAQCRGATMDVGCGPGRMSAHLLEQGHAVLGVDIVREAVEQARTRGVSAIRRNVFDPMPGEGRWDTVLLADGNIGIGGAPEALLRRCAELVDRSGRVVCDLAQPGTGVSVHEALLVSGERRTKTFPWARVGADAIDELATSAGLQVDRVRQHGDRWFAVLGHRAA